MIKQLKPFEDVESISDFIDAPKKPEAVDALSKAENVLKKVLPTKEDGNIDVEASISVINSVLDSAMGIQATSGLTPSSYAMLKVADLIDKKVAKEHPTMFALFTQSKLPSTIISLLKGGQ